MRQGCTLTDVARQEEKPCLVLYQALNCLLKRSMRLLVVVLETLQADVLYPMQRLNGHLSEVTVADNGLRSPHRLYGIQYGKGLRTVPVGRETKRFSLSRMSQR